jgi:ectoine hydroxylase-related dioxygenase (phytanoyl-CoA dioxygenase family)
MNDREKFLFDLQGFLVVRNFLTKEEVDALNAAIDANMDRKTEDGNSFTGNSTTLVGTHKRGFFSGMMTWPKPWCQPYRDIIAHPKAIPYLNAIHGRGWRLDHEPFILTADKASEGLILHGATNHHFDGSEYYTYRNGEMRCGMVVLQYQLADVNEGDGGLCVIPGSHKANFPSPIEIREWESDRELVYNVPCKAGDMVIFNEATMHGTLPWTADHERRSLLVRYSPMYLHFAGGFYKTEFPEWVDELTEAQRAVLEPPYIYHRPLIEDDGETVVRPLRDGLYK